ncbi:hypothetical protein [Pseudomonas sp.]|uniref:hypothetical protein n=1 Tax=Pseudomonas sp. TaxID=306 RepID=UPI0029AA1C55|nr:hypothetical protein [Pseudomonas sp.]MDX3744645.1 hypothetical protein [Pseudomonas sp.]
MSKTWRALTLIAALYGSECLAGQAAAAGVDLGFMHGYLKVYEGCLVSWSERTKSFLRSGNNCVSLSQERLVDDAATDYQMMRAESKARTFADYYAEKRSRRDGYSEQEAKLSALNIWRAGCSDFKSGMNAGNFQGWLRLDDAEKSHPKVRKTAVVGLYMDGWDTARNLKGIVNCRDLAASRVDDYISGIDIRR